MLNSSATCSGVPTHSCLTAVPGDSVTGVFILLVVSFCAPTHSCLSGEILSVLGILVAMDVLEPVVMLEVKSTCPCECCSLAS